MRKLVGSLCILAALGALAPAAARAMDPSDVEVLGTLDLVGTTGDEETIATNTLGPHENSFDTARLDLQVNAQIQRNLSAFTEFSYDDGGYARFVGGFVRFADPRGRDIYLEVGKLPLHLGSFPDRTSAQRNSLIGVPLMYQYRTDLRSDQVPVNGEDLVANEGKGFESDYLAPGLTGVGGDEGYALPILNESYWDFGAVVVGTASAVEFAFGITNGSAADPQTIDDNQGKQFLTRIGLAPAPWVRAGVSVSQGPYLYGDVQEVLPPGATVSQYDQTLVASDLELSNGHGILYAEYVYNRFESPYVGNLDAQSWYAEGKYTFRPGWYVAGRYDRMTFGDVALSGGGVASWDADVQRWEAGVGFKPSKRLVTKLVHQQTEVATSPPQRFAFEAFQLSVAF